MSQIVKFPDLRPPPRPTIAPLPSLSDYRQIKPTLATRDVSTEITPAMRRSRRQKWVIGLSVAVALHAVLVLAFLLTPKMRLKWSPPPEDWVPVVSLPKPEPAIPPPPVPDQPASPVQATSPAKSAKHSVTKPKSPPSTPSSG